MTLLTKEQIFAANDSKTMTVSVPEWGGEVIVKTMSASEKDEWEYLTFIDKDTDARAKSKKVRATLCALCIVDEKGNSLFSTQDVEQLGKKSAKALTKVYDVCCKLNFLTEDDIEELKKN